MSERRRGGRWRVVHRLGGYDYGWPGFYFITMCTAHRAHIFGSVVRRSMVLSAAGDLAQRYWREIPEHFRYTRVDEFIVMPDHVHGIIEILPCGSVHAARPRTFGIQLSGSLSIIIRSYKSIVTREVNLLRGTPGAAVWQASYYDRIIQKAADVDRVRAYIRNNPVKW